MPLAVTVAAPAEAARTSLRPAAGPAAVETKLIGTGFEPRSRVALEVGGVRRAPIRADERGNWLVTLRIPAGARARTAIVATSPRRRVRTVYSVRRSFPPAPVTEVATDAGARLRYAPHAQVAGMPFSITGAGLGAGGRVELQFHGTKTIVLRASLSGSLRHTLEIPEAPAGSRGIGLRVRGRTLRLAFTLLPDPVVAAAGDIACGAESRSSQCRQMATADVLAALRPAAVLALGDTQYELGEFQNFQQFYAPSWGRLKAVTRPAIGNHEYGTSDVSTCGFACGYFDYFNGIGLLDGPAGRRGEGFYAFDAGAWRLYALNSNCSRRGAPGCAVGGPQEAWLRRDLAAHPRHCTLAFMHHPMFTSDTRDFDGASFRDQLRPLWQAFHDAGGDLVLAGHSHFYERYAPQDPFGQPTANGIRQFIVGTGGRNVYGFGTIEPNSEVREGKTFGVLALTLRAHAYGWSFAPIAGSSFTDAGVSRCR